MTAPIAPDTAEPETTKTSRAAGAFATVRANAPAALLFLGVAVHLLFLLSLKFGWLNPLFNDTMHRFGPGGDFFSIYAAGVKARAGQSVYTIGGQVETVPYAYAFRYAPLVAYTLGAALSLLPAIKAYALWLIACEMALLRNIRLTLALAPDKRTGYVAAALWLLFTPYYLELFVGQFTFITASLVFWAYLGWQDKAKGKDARAADWLWAGAVWLKMMPLLFLPVALLRGRGKAALTALLVLLASSAVYFSQYPQDFAVFAATNAQEAPAGHSGNLGMMAFLFHAAREKPGPFALLRGVVLAVLVACLGWLTVRAGKPTPRPLPVKEGVRKERRGHLSESPSRTGEGGAKRREGSIGQQGLLALYAACSAVYLLGYKDVWEHHYVLLLPPIVLLALRRESPWLWLPPFLVSALPTLFVFYDLPGLGYNEDPQGYWHRNVSLLHHGLKPLAPLWLLTGLLWGSLRDALPQRTQRWRARVRRAVMAGGLALKAAALLAGAVLSVGGVQWSRAAILDQRQVVQPLVWSPSVFQLQSKRNTCGPAALASVCRHFGIAATEAEMARLSGTTSGGTSMLGLRDAAARKGLAAEGVQMTLQNLRSAPCPCILFFQAGHYAVLTGVRGADFYLADPSLGQRVLTGAQLTALWHGQVLLVGPAGVGAAP